jgi:NADPH:quinone reductase-like Zn-dependent oxidoreductase
MRAIHITRFLAVGEPIPLSEVPSPSSAAEEAVVRIEAAGINPSDLKNAQGALKHKTTLPRTIGRDYAGTVIEGPPDWLGKEVWGSGGDLGITRDGTFAELIAVPVASLRLKPANLSMQQAAVVGIPFITAYSGLVDICHAKQGDLLLVVGASGSVGTAVIQLANSLGMKVIGTARNQSDQLRAPVTAVVDLEKEDLAEAVRKHTNGRGVDVCYNAVGGPTFEPDLASLANGGRMVCITSVGQRQVQFDLVDFYHNQTKLFGLDTLRLTLNQCADILEKVRPGFEDGSLEVTAPTPVPLSEAAKAFEQLEKGTMTKFVLVPER